MASIDLPAFRSRAAQGLLTCRAHPTADLLIWNYTPKCVYSRAWDEVTIQARGLITTSEGTIVSRPFKKFWNVEEHVVSLPNEPFKVTEKMDGSLGISYFVQGRPFIATRGSFTSWQALCATALLHERGYATELAERYTYLFEIIVPHNRIVVDYGDTEDLVLLAVIDTETGREFDIHRHLSRSQYSFPFVKQYDGIQDIKELQALDEENKEGFVLHFESGLRLKAKFETYVKLHRVLTQTSARTIWEYLKENKPLAELLDRVPEEFTAWVKHISRDLSERYRLLHLKTHATYDELRAQATLPLPFRVEGKGTLSFSEVERIRRAMNRYMHEQFAKYPDIAPFLDILYTYAPIHAKGKLHDAIWDSLYPPHSRPFMVEEEAA